MIRVARGILALALALAGCGDGDEGTCNGASVGGGLLEGSYCESVDLTWTEVRTKVQTSGDRSFFSVEYVRPAGDALEKTLIVQFDVSQVVPAVDQPIFFLQASGSVRRITTVIQNLTSDLDPTRCTLTFLEPYTGEVGSQVRGEFALFFANSGRTLRGEFEGALVDAAAEAGG